MLLRYLANAPDFNDPQEYTLDMEVSVPHSDVNIEGDTVEFSISSSGSISVSVLSGDTGVRFERTLTKQEDVVKIPHNLVSLVSTDHYDTDQPLSLLRRLGNSDDRLTPDYINLESGVVAEIGTTRGNLANAYEYKKLYYGQALIERGVSLGKLWIVIVGLNSVYTNVLLEQHEVASLISAYRLGWSILSQIKDLGYPYPIHESMADIRESVLENVRLLNETPLEPNDQGISEANLKYYMGLRPDPEALFYSVLSETSKLKLPKADWYAEYEESVRGNILDGDDPIYQWPLFYISKTNSHNNTRKMYLPEHVDAVSDQLEFIWNEAITTADANNDFWEPDDKNDYGRVRFPLSKYQKEYLSMRGTVKKGKTEDFLYKQKQFFSLRAPTDDIVKFLDNDEQFYRIDSLPPYNEVFNQLANESDDISLYNRLQRFKIFNAVQVLEEIMIEVNASLNQFCKPNQFVLKKLLNHDIWVLIKPTNPSNQLSVSVNFSSAYTFLENPGKYSSRTTDFFTVNRHKLSILCTCSQRFISFFSYVCEIYSLSPLDVVKDLENNPASHPRVRRHLCFLLLTMLEGKSKTSETLMLARYAYMEVLTGDSVMRPMKIFQKIPTAIRSRLMVFIIKQYNNVFPRMVKLPPVKGERSEGESFDQFHNLISWLDDNPIDSVQQALELSYIGMLHNKDESDETQASFEIVQKIIKEDLKLLKANPRFLGLENPPITQMENHEFSPDMVALGAKLLKEEIKKHHGQNIDGIMKDIIIEALVRCHTQDLGTTKASALRVDQPVYKPGCHKTRVKCLEALITNVKNDDLRHNPFMKLYDVFLEVKEKKLYINLFKKDQLGSIREIYVLEFKGRICIFFVETIFRSIAKLMPSEMLTKGDQKVLRSDQHFRKLRMKKVILTSIDSCDATTWAQRFHMRMFACMAANLLPQEFIRPVCHILNLVADKVIELPEVLLSQFLRHRDRVSNSDEINHLKSEFLTGSSDHFLNKGEILMRNKTNMMQGILHFTSSCYHAAMLSTLKTFCQTLTNQHAQREESVELVITTKCSSDDSSVIKTFCGEASIKTCKKLARIMSRMKRIISLCVGVSESDSKSTLNNFNHIEEFNSVWLVGNTVMMPKIKFVWSSCQFQVISDLISRQIQFTNARQQMTENGIHQITASVAAICQARLYYYTLGFGLVPEFPWYANILQSKPHPALGYFLLPKRYLAGIANFDYLLVNKLSSSRLASKVERAIFDQGMEINEHSRPNTAVHLLMGDNRKYKSFLKRVDLPDFETYYTENTIELFRPPISQESLLMSLSAQAHSPGLPEAFTYKTASLIIASGVYALTRPCYTRTVLKDKEKSREKISLLDWVESIELREEMSPIDIEVLYGGKEILRTLDLAMERVTPMVFVEEPRRVPDKLVKIHTIKRRELTTMSFYQCARRRWFPELEQVGSTRSFKMSLEVYQRLCPWFIDDPESSLQLSPFSTIVSLVNFIKGFQKLESVLTILAPVDLTSGPQDILYNTMRRKTIPGMIASGVSGGSFRDKKHHGVLGDILMLLNGPSGENRKLLLCKAIMDQYPDFLNSISTPETYLLSCHKTIANFLLMDSLHHKRSSEVARLCMMTRTGKFGYFIKEQTKRDNQWFGVGKYAMVCEGHTVIVNMRNDLCTSLEVDKKGLLFYSSRHNALSEVLRILMLRHDGTHKKTHGFTPETGIIPGMTNGVPVLIVETLPPVLVNAEDLFLDVTDNKLNMMMTLRDGAIRVIGITADKMICDPTRQTYDIGLKSEEMSWMTDSSITPSFAINKISKSNHDANHWRRSTLLSRLASRGYVHRDFEVESDESDAPIDVNEKSIEDLMSKFQEMDDDKFDDIETKQEDVGSDDEIDKNLQMMERVVTSKYAHPASHSRFWDSVIDFVSRTVNVRNLVTSKYYVMCPDSLSEAIGNLFDNDSRPTRPVEEDSINTIEEEDDDDSNQWD